MTNNMHYLFNKTYFDMCFAGNVTQAERILVKYKYPDSVSNAYKGMREAATDCFTLSTMYPGLLIGSGYPHDCDVDHTIVGGFFFDEISGLPVIPGSTLKGMLRSYFEDDNVAKDREYKKLIGDIAGELLANLSEEEKVDFVKAFVNTSFEAEDGTDVFLGAVPQVKGKRIFTIDYITPHGDATSTPVPLKMLKVRPGVKYDFLFILNDFEYMSASGKSCTISGETKARIFKELILLGGIGAKTNIGFGQFTEDEIPIPDDRYDAMSDGPVKTKSQGPDKKKTSNPDRHDVSQKQEYEGTVTGYNPKMTRAYIKLDNGESAKLYYKKAKCSSAEELVIKFPVGARVKVRYLGKNAKGLDDWELVK